jgi:2-haloacid dehalogenase
MPEPAPRGDAPTPPSAIVFDFGGVLVDWNPRYLYGKLFDDPEAMERFLEEIEFDRWNLEQDRGRPFTEAVAVQSARFPHRAELIAAYHERWTESIRGPIEGTVEILRELHDAGRELYGLSNWSAETFALVRDRYPFFRWFEAIVLSGEERVCKPEPEIFGVLLERVGRPAGDCVLIDDSEANIAAARALGFRAIRFRSPDQLRAALREMGVLG